MAALRRDGLAIDEQEQHGASRLKDVAGRHHEVGPFANLDRAQAVGNAQDPGWRERDSLQGKILRQAKSDGRCGLVRQISSGGRCTWATGVRPDRHRYPGCMEPGRIGIPRVVGIVIEPRHIQRSRDDDRHARLLDRGGDLPCFARA